MPSASKALGFGFALVLCVAAAPKPQPVTITFATEPNPPTSGEVEFRVTVTDSTGQPISDAGVSVQLVMPSMREMRTDVKLPSAGAGVYRGTGQIEMSGRWDATITVTRDGQRPTAKRVMVIVQ